MRLVARSRVPSPLRRLAAEPVRRLARRVGKRTARRLAVLLRAVDPPIDVSDHYTDHLGYAIAGMLTRGNLYCFDLAVRELPRDTAIVEVGSFCGLSAAALAYYRRRHRRAERFVSCDTWAFDRAMEGEAPVSRVEYAAFVKQSFMRTMDTFAHTDRPFAVETSSDEFFEQWRAGSTCTDVFGRSVTLGGPIGFAYVDGNHGYDFVARDWRNVDAFLAPGGFVLFDDSYDGSGWGVTRLMPEVLASGRYELVARNPNYLFRKRPGATAAPARRPKVLVLGREERAFLSVVRSLGRRGFEVHVGWVPPDDVSCRSRYIAAAHDLAPHTTDGDAWRDALVALCRREEFDLVVPTNDATVIPLQLHRASLEPHGRFYLISDRAFEVAFDKGRTHDLATGLGIPVPAQRRLAPAAVGAGVDPSWYPLVLKPLHSRSLHALDAKRLVRTIERPDELAQGLAMFADQPEVLVQRHFSGMGTGIEVLAADGEVLVAFQHLRLHTRPGGACSYRESSPLEPAMLDAVRRMVRAVGYTGVAMFEFAWNRATGEWVFLEINARFWGSLPLCLHAGVDFPSHLYDLLVEGRRDFPTTYRVGVACRNWRRDLAWLRDGWRAQLAPRAVVHEIALLLRGREANDAFVLDDVRPGLATVGQVTREIARGARRRLRRDGGPRRPS